MTRNQTGPPLFLGVLCALAGAVCVGIFLLIDPSHPEYERRWVALVFGVMSLVAGFQFLKEPLRQRVSREADDLLNALARTLFFGGFAALALNGALGDAAASGGLPFVPAELNDVIAKAMFGTLGVVLAFVALFSFARLLAGVRNHLQKGSQSG